MLTPSSGLSVTMAQKANINFSIFYRETIDHTSTYISVFGSQRGNMVHAKRIPDETRGLFYNYKILTVDEIASWVKCSKFL